MVADVVKLTVELTLNRKFRNFPGGPVLRLCACIAVGKETIFSQRTKILHALHWGQKKKKKVGGRLLWIILVHPMQSQGPLTVEEEAEGGQQKTAV